MLRIMSHNQWKCDKNSPVWENNGLDCSAEVRMRGFVRVFQDICPDIVGCQEVSAVMADYLIRYLAEAGMRYSLLWGRDTPIIYRPDKLALIDSDFSLFPLECPGFDGEFNNHNTKSWNLAVFQSKITHETFIFATTHLWWKSEIVGSENYQKGSDAARAYQLEIVMDKIAAYKSIYNCPAILVGDLNTPYNTPAIQSALNRGYIHAHEGATDYRDETEGYHPCGHDGFGPYCNGGFVDAIDHIFVKDAPADLVKRFARYSPEYYLPLSDHSPVYIDADL